MLNAQYIAVHHQYSLGSACRPTMLLEEISHSLSPTSVWLTFVKLFYLL